MAKRIKITTVKYKKRVNRPPLRVARPISTVEPADTTLKIRTESYEQLGVSTGGHTHFVKASTLFGYNYVNVYDLIANSPSYVKYKGLFGKMRIESLKILCYSVQSPSSDGLATQLIAFFPNFVNSSTLVETLPANDDTLPLNYNSSRPHVRNYKFKKGYYFGPEGTGYGVDFDPGKIQYLPGQISVVRAFSPQFPSQAGYNIIYNVIIRAMSTFSEPIW
mgnify:FL=1